jgi:hypothetical protein
MTKSKTKLLATTSPQRFGLSSFTDILPTRHPIIGEDPGSFAGFHEGMMRALAPVTPYECVMAEHLVSIEWELLQHRRMREACLLDNIKRKLRQAAINREHEKHDKMFDAAWEKHVAEGGDEEDWEDPVAFDKKAAGQLADDLAVRATSPDPDTQARAQAEIVELGLTPLEIMSDAYTARFDATATHDDIIQELERRRREVKRDYDTLQKARPLDVEVIDG